MNPQNATSILTELMTRIAHVRRRLVILGLLRFLALIFVAISLYVLVYAGLDHRFHFSAGARWVALVILVVILGGMVLACVRNLAMNRGLKHAASHIESARHYHQQLLAAIEYHQQPVDYPYSESLARTMVSQLWEEARHDDFSTTVPAWKLWVFAAVLFLGLVVTGLCVRHHYAYLARYAARLGQPTASLDPLPATRLKSLNGDMAVERNETVVFQAGIEGRLPQTGQLKIQARVTAQSPESVPEPAYDPVKTLTLQPIAGETPADAMFQGKYSFEREGLYRYQFTAMGEATPWHMVRVCEFPAIVSITADISVDIDTRQLTTQQTVTDFVLSALAGSKAKITVQANCGLEGAKVKLLDDRTESYAGHGLDHFTFETLLDRAGRLEFRLQDTSGLWSRELPPLTIKIKQDEPPTFVQRHPEGDCQVTNVASVPIQFEIKDDFGLVKATLCLAFGEGQTEQVSAVLSDDKRTAQIDHMLELEQYDLDVGDAILYHVKALDVATGSASRTESAVSDVMILEVKPYRRIWLQSPGGPPGPSGAPAELDPSLIHDALIEILQYTRAFLKKTWRLADQVNADKSQESDTAKSVAIASDIDYAKDNLTLILDDPRYAFNGSEIEVIHGVLDEFESARSALMAHEPADAIPPETRAYRILRRLVDDRIRADCQPGGGSPPEKPDKLKLAEVQHLTRLERARTAWQLNAVSQQLAEVAREQDALDRTFMHFLDDQPKQNKPVKVNDEKSWVADPPPAGAESQAPPGSPGQAFPPDKTVEGALRASTPVGKGGSKQGSLADMMKVLRAHQRQLRTELAALEAQLARLPVDQDPEGDFPSPTQAREAARTHMDLARTGMTRFETLLAEQYYDLPDPAQLAQEAPAMLSAIRSELMMARQALRQEVSAYAEDNMEQLKQMALNVEAMANAYETAVTAEERRQLLNTLSAVTAQFNLSSGGPNIVGGGSGAAQPGKVVAVKGFGDRDIIDAARFAAREFLSKTLDVTKRPNSRVPETSTGSLRFYGQENDFFENAARSQPE
ncbi:MAG: hypothetical protein K9N55_02845 [Phycisphaerae bacterium]|nr:hypothetical protein [Phycisphaerae bacterium]